MKNLPSHSTTNLLNGIWFVHEEPEIILRVWLSTLNGKEKIYANEDLVTEKRNLTSFSTFHGFEYAGTHFDVEVYASNAMLMELECNIFRDGKLVFAQVNKMQPSGSYQIVKTEDKQSIVLRAKGRFRKSGVKLLNDFDLEAAATEFRKALSIETEDAESHFLLACIYSLEEKKEEAFTHLESALKLGMGGRDRILQEDKLAYLRIQPEFEAFRDRHFE